MIDVRKGGENRNPTRLGPSPAHNQRQAHAHRTRPAIGDRAAHGRAHPRPEALLQVAAARADALQDVARVRGREQQHNQADRRAVQNPLLQLLRSHANHSAQP